MVSLDRRSINRLSVLSTLIDSALEFRRGRPKSGLLLLGAAALSARLPGIGTGASLALRAIRRLR
ncbi:hypothetical protein NP511_17255 [Natrinema thermotolerans]|uniref:Uncharacterized protein n=1 Tax=Natrinema thermotolerans TaxID=121872 RepID=A0AAF0P9T1_9EURY|nr:hypothetical protein [Natrinema thermotolerans]ELZ10247.1 hypothetical protein C478_15182 [Natrinema thermotolerans DSM 11552]QCC60112.1 hypothetical protein DVR14_16350 [Natrinema thermotolerans]QCC61026.1 hypothetical protein DVR14_20470 [Natrinema thermotolerans]WMT07122.1 hypothetical protein NP511_17255 [Natrinema thermotolerans]